MASMQLYFSTVLSSTAAALAHGLSYLVLRDYFFSTIFSGSSF